MEQNKGKFFIVYSTIDRSEKIRYANMVAIVSYRSFEDLLTTCGKLAYEKEVAEHWRTVEITILNIKEVECYVLVPDYEKTKKETAEEIIEMLDHYRMRFVEVERNATDNGVDGILTIQDIVECCNIAQSVLSNLKLKIYSKYIFEEENKGNETCQ